MSPASAGRAAAGGSARRPACESIRCSTCFSEIAVNPMILRDDEARPRIVPRREFRRPVSLIVRIAREEDLVGFAILEDNDRSPMAAVEILEEIHVFLDHLVSRLGCAVKLD